MRCSLILLLWSICAGAAQPNVLLIIGDDQHYGDYGFMKHPHIRTPHLDKLATESLLFENGFVPTSLCRASLATMITGLEPQQHKITSNDPPLPKGMTPGQANKAPAYLAMRTKMVEIFERSPSLPKLLAKAGYVSHQSGKWWEGNACRCGGFTEGMTIGDFSTTGRHGDAGLAIGRKGLEEVYTFLDKAKSEKKPFFVWYAPIMPHSPHNPPARLLAKYQSKTPSIHIAKYWAMCEWFDETIGDVLKKLDDTGLAKDTIVIYLHDNGWIQNPNDGGYAPKSKRSPYNGGLRTPIMIRWPGHVKPAVSQELASSIDLAPTILHACGLKPTAAMHGVNLLDADAVAKREYVHGATFEHNAVDIEKPAANLQYRWLADRKYKLIVGKDGTAELYDWQRDPSEEKNLIKAEPRLADVMNVQLDAWWSGR